MLRCKECGAYYRTHPLANMITQRCLCGSPLAEATEEAVDDVNRPPHYTAGKIEVIDFLDDQEPHIGAKGCQVIKYLCRHRLKGQPLKDLRKAEWYLKRMIEQLEKEGAKPLVATDAESGETADWSLSERGEGK